MSCKGCPHPAQRAGEPDAQSPVRNATNIGDRTDEGELSRSSPLYNVPARPGPRPQSGMLKRYRRSTDRRALSIVTPAQRAGEAGRVPVRNATNIGDRTDRRALSIVTPARPGAQSPVRTPPSRIIQIWAWILRQRRPDCARHRQATAAPIVTPAKAGAQSPVRNATNIGDRTDEASLLDRHPESDPPSRNYSNVGPGSCGSVDLTALATDNTAALIVIAVHNVPARLKGPVRTPPSRIIQMLGLDLAAAST